MAHDPIDMLIEDLTPIRPHGTARPAMLLAGLTLAGALLVLMVLGPRSALGAGFGTPMFLVRSGLLLLLGLASFAAIVAMARPAVGRPIGGWRWAAGTAAIMPIGAVILAATSRDPLGGRLVPSDGLECLGWSIGLGIVFAAFLTGWLRRGAPTSPERAGTVVGLAAGSFGTLAYSLHCPHDDIVYIGLWYTLAIAVVALSGRLLLPRFLRW